MEHINALFKQLNITKLTAFIGFLYLLMINMSIENYRIWINYTGRFKNEETLIGNNS